MSTIIGLVLVVLVMALCHARNAYLKASRRAERVAQLRNQYRSSQKAPWDATNAYGSEKRGGN